MEMIGEAFVAVSTICSVELLINYHWSQKILLKNEHFHYILFIQYVLFTGIYGLRKIS